MATHTISSIRVSHTKTKENEDSNAGHAAKIIILSPLLLYIKSYCRQK